MATCRQRAALATSSHGWKTTWRRQPRIVPPARLIGSSRRGTARSTVVTAQRRAASRAALARTRKLPSSRCLTSMRWTFTLPVTCTGMYGSMLLLLLRRHAAASRPRVIHGLRRTWQQHIKYRFLSYGFSARAPCTVLFVSFFFAVTRASGLRTTTLWCKRVTTNRLARRI